MRVLILIQSILISVPGISQDGTFTKYEGRIINAKDGSGLPYVNIAFEGTVYGTSTNEQGYFKLKKPENLKFDSVQISCVGFLSKKVKLQDIQRLKVVELRESVKNLKEVTIKAEEITPEEVIRKVIEKIPSNYIQGPYSQLKLYRTNTFNSELQPVAIEVLREEYDDNGYKTSALYPLRYQGYFKTIMGRLSDNTSNHPFKNFQRSFAPPTANSDVVDVRNNNFLSISNLKKYEFEFENSTVDSVIVIKFRNKKPNHRNSAALAPTHYYGTIWINQSDYTILKVGSTTIMNKKKVWKAESYSSFESEEIWFNKEVIEYRKHGNHYHLNKLVRWSNWDQNKNGSTTVVSLSIELGEKDKDDTDFTPSQKYSLDKWEKLTGGATPY
ncbi:MAG: carboxypeptidase-like regulatory domain-containing protein [Bacteroidota bacterium]